MKIKKLNSITEARDALLSGKKIYTEAKADTYPTDRDRREQSVGRKRIELARDYGYTVDAPVGGHAPFNLQDRDCDSFTRCVTLLINTDKFIDHKHNTTSVNASTDILDDQLAYARDLNADYVVCIGTDNVPEADLQNPKYKIEFDKPSGMRTAEYDASKNSFIYGFKTDAARTAAIKHLNSVYPYVFEDFIMRYKMMTAYDAEKRAYGHREFYN